MKCVCPMGGNRVCPNDCPLAIWASLSATDRKAQRKSVAEKLYKQDFTMEQIATQLGVTNQTISNDLREFPNDLEIKKSAKTASNPKGAGRPKGSKKGKATRAPKLHVDAATVIALRDKGVSISKVAEQTGVPERQVRHIVEEEAIRREAVAEAAIDPATLSLSAKEKFDMAIRKYKKQLDREFVQRVTEEVRKRIDEMVLPYWREQIAEAKTLYERRKGFMDKDTFKLIWSALHPDSRKSITDKKLAEAFDAFSRMEKFLLNEEDSPTSFGELPSSAAEWDAMKRSAAAGRRTGRNGIRVRS
jgi:predicted transcriptional regulator